MMLALGDKKDADEGMFSFRLGAKYMVVDAGGNLIFISIFFTEQMFYQLFIIK